MQVIKRIPHISKPRKRTGAALIRRIESQIRKWVYLLPVCSFIILPANLQAQESVEKKPADADSAKTVPADSLSAQPDSSASDSAAVLPKAPPPLFKSPQTAFRLEPDRRSEFLFQEMAQLGSFTLPVVPIAAGEVGKPHYFATGFLPARGVNMFVDDIYWRPGVYGTVDLTSVPEAEIDVTQITSLTNHEQALHNGPTQFYFNTDSLNFGIPFSDAEYSKGPFGADAVRIGFGRAFSHRLSGFLNATFSSADGRLGEAEYDGHKGGAKFIYQLNSKLRAKYRYFNSINESGVAVPFFPEEWPSVESARHKEVRLFHSLEIAHTHRFMARAFNWIIKEELNDVNREVRHRLRETGVEAHWRWQREHVSVTTHLRAASEAVSSSTITYNGRFVQQFGANVGMKLSKHFWFQGAGHFRHNPDWPSDYSASASLLWQPNQKNVLFYRGGNSQFAPALAERSNALALFSNNEKLQAVKLRYDQIGATYRDSKLALQLVAGIGQWHDGFELAIKDSATIMLTNSVETKTLAGMQIALRYNPFSSFWVGAQGAIGLNNLPEHYWFWYQPKSHARVYVETHWRIFEKTIEVLPRLSLRYLGKRSSSTFSNENIIPVLEELPAATTMDFQIRFLYGEAALFFSFENLFDQQFQWRTGVPDPGRVFRWGVWWTFLN